MNINPLFSDILNTHGVVPPESKKAKSEKQDNKQNDGKKEKRNTPNP